MNINKRFLQLTAALWILIFHLWINVSGSGGEQFLIRIGYVGVDIFFFVSAWSMTGHPEGYREFIQNRFRTVYLEFLFFVAAAAIRKHWGVGKILRTLLFADLFRLGGGAFLWFVPAIMLLYILFPLFLKIRSRYKVPVCLLCWFLLSLALDRLFGYHEIFIFSNRIPVILLGYLCRKYSFQDRQNRWITGGICVTLGLVLLYLGGYQHKLQTPFADLCYVLAIPLVWGLARISSGIPKSRIVDTLSGASLEIYGIQMIWGPALVQRIYRFVKDPVLTDLIMAALILLLSVVIHTLWIRILRLIPSKKE